MVKKALILPLLWVSGSALAAGLSPSEMHNLMEGHLNPSTQRGVWAPDWQAPEILAHGEDSLENTAGTFVVGASAMVITPTEYELYTDVNGDATYQPDTDTFEDTGRDQLWDWQEPGALGADGQPGRAGLDDDLDAIVDEFDEYGDPRSDDLLDPNQDNYHRQDNPDGTENNGVFDAVALAGFGGLFGVDIRPAVGIHDDIWSRAIAISDGDDHAIFIVNDTIGLLFHYMNPVKRALSASTGVPFENIVISSTHTHSGPDTIGIWGGPLDPAYMNFLMDQMYAAGMEAWQARRPAKVQSATAKPRACYDKETLVMKGLEDCNLSDYFPENLDGSSSYDQYIVQNDTRDPWVRRFETPIQHFTDLDGQTIATVVSYDTHPEIFLDENQLISSDYPHFTREYLEAELGGIALYFAGSVGSQMSALRSAPLPLYDEAGTPLHQAGLTDAEGNPVPQWASGVVERTRSAGYEAARFALEALEGAPFDGTPDVIVDAQAVDVKVSNPIFRGIIQNISRDDNFDEWDYMITAPYCTRLGCIRTQIQMISVGNATYITVPGEFPPEYLVGRDESTAPYADATNGEYEDWYFPPMPHLASVMRSSELFMVGLANNYFGYAMAEADYTGFTNSDHPNWYEEVYMADPCFGDMIGNRLFEMLDSPTRFNPRCQAHPDL